MSEGFDGKEKLEFVESPLNGNTREQRNKKVERKIAEINGEKKV